VTCQHFNPSSEENQKHHGYISHKSKETILGLLLKGWYSLISLFIISVSHIMEVYGHHLKEHAQRSPN